MGKLFDHLARNALRYLAAIVFLLFAVLCVVGCESAGAIRYNPESKQLEVRQPGKAISPATATVGQDGTVTISTGARQEQTPAMIGAHNAKSLNWIGAGLILIGVVGLGLKAKFPVIPTNLGTLLIGAGIVVIAMARVSGWVLTAIVIAAAAASIWIAWKANVKDKRKAMI